MEFGNSLTINVALWGIGGTTYFDMIERSSSMPVSIKKSKLYVCVDDDVNYVCEWVWVCVNLCLLVHQVDHFTNYYVVV